MKMIFSAGRLASVLLLALLAVGCTTTRVDWASRVGTYTFDNALLELGPPDKQAKLQNGSIVAEWLTSRGGTYVYPAYGYGHYPYRYGAPAAPTYSTAPDYY